MVAWQGARHRLQCQTRHAALKHATFATMRALLMLVAGGCPGSPVQGQQRQLWRTHHGSAVCTAAGRVPCAQPGRVPAARGAAARQLRCAQDPPGAVYAVRNTAEAAGRAVATVSCPRQHVAVPSARDPRPAARLPREPPRGAAASDPPTHTPHRCGQRAASRNKPNTRGRRLTGRQYRPRRRCRPNPTPPNERPPFRVPPPSSPTPYAAPSICWRRCRLATLGAPCRTPPPPDACPPVHSAR